MKDYIIKDSSIWQDDGAFSVEKNLDCSLKIGVVRDIVEIDGPDIAYIVEVWLGGKYTPIQCTRSSRFGGVYNYEEFTYRGMEPDDSSASDGLFDYKKGDVVLIAYLYGDSREGIIINGINHPARPRLFDLDSGIVYQSEFNGINKSITNTGEYTTTFKGIPTNIAELESPSTGEPIPAPEYDAAIGYTYMKYDETGSWIISDNDGVEIDAETGEQTSSETLQSIFIDKPNGKIIITSGKTTLTIDKAEESYTIVNKVTTFESEDEWNLNTKMTNIISEEVNIESTTINTKGKWKHEGNVEIMGNTKQTGNVDIAGNLTAKGQVKLGLGSPLPLIQDIPIIITYLGPIPLPGIAFPIKTIFTKAS